MGNFKLEWDKTGDHFYETGLDRGVLFVKGASGYGAGVEWNGLTSVSEKPSGAESTSIWADNQKYLNLVSAEEFAATLEAYTYPPEFGVCDGSADPISGVSIFQQSRSLFGLAYRTRIGNDERGDALGYKIHLIYNCLAAPSERSYQTVNDSPEAISFSWEISTTPENVSGYSATANITIDSTKVNANKLAAFEQILYGTPADEETSTAAVEARLPLPNEVISLLTPPASETD